jgi:hypothetical protein
MTMVARVSSNSADTQICHPDHSHDSNMVMQNAGPRIENDCVDKTNRNLPRRLVKPVRRETSRYMWFISYEHRRTELSTVISRYQVLTSKYITDCKDLNVCCSDS